MIGKEWDPENRNGDILEDPDEAGDIEPLNSDESFLPMEVASPVPSETNPALSEETIMISPEAVALQDTADSPRDPPLYHSLLPDLCITRHKS